MATFPRHKSRLIDWMKRRTPDFFAYTAKRFSAETPDAERFFVSHTLYSMSHSAENVDGLRRSKRIKTLVDINNNKLLIQIKSVMERDNKQYYIANKNGELIRYIYDNNHMDWILEDENGYGATDRNDKPLTIIKENTLYDINNVNIIDSIKCKADIIGTANNIYKDGIYTDRLQNNLPTLDLKTDFAYIESLVTTDADYFNLTLHGKIVYLFEAFYIFDNMEGYYLLKHSFIPDKPDDLYMFKQAPTDIFDISNDMINNGGLNNGGLNNDFLIRGHLFIHYFYEIGTIEEIKEAHFSLYNITLRK